MRSLPTAAPLPVAAARVKGCCAPVAAPLPAERVAELAAVHQALADPMRVQLVHILSEARDRGLLPAEPRDESGGARSRPPGALRGSAADQLGFIRSRPPPIAEIESGKNGARLGSLARTEPALVLRCLLRPPAFAGGGG